MMYGFGWNMGLGGWLTMVGFVALVVGVAVVFVWAVGSGGRFASPRDQDIASDDRIEVILRERFARGELTEAEYQQARKTLGMG